MNKLREKYIKEIAPKLKKDLGLKNVYKVPNLEKILINVGLGEAIKNPQALEKVSDDLAIITGQKPIRTKAKRAISNFDLKLGEEVGLKVTLRGDRMWDFFEKLVNIVLPRVKDFRGVSRSAFDTRGNYSLGIREHTVFPETDPNKVEKIRSLQVTIVTTAEEDKSALELLKLLGMPFAREGEAQTVEKIKELMRKEKKELARMKARRVAEGREIEEKRGK